MLIPENDAEHLQSIIQQSQAYYADPETGHRLYRWASDPRLEAYEPPAYDEWEGYVADYVDQAELPMAEDPEVAAPVAEPPPQRDRASSSKCQNVQAIQAWYLREKRNQDAEHMERWRREFNERSGASASSSAPKPKPKPAPKEKPTGLKPPRLNREDMATSTTADRHADALRAELNRNAREPSHDTTITVSSEVNTPDRESQYDTDPGQPVGQAQVTRPVEAHVEQREQGQRTLSQYRRDPEGRTTTDIQRPLLPFRGKGTGAGRSGGTVRVHTNNAFY